MPVQVGSPAPDFKAQAYLGSSDEFKEISLEDYKGKWLCLYFYPMDFTFVCPTEIVAFDKAPGRLPGTATANCSPRRATATMSTRAGANRMKTSRV